MFFADGALVHGTTPWRNPIPRRTILNKYSSRSFNRSGGDLVAPENRWGEQVVEGMSDSMLAIMRGPDRDVFNANVPRLVVQVRYIAAVAADAAANNFAQLLIFDHGLYGYAQDDGVIDVSYERGNALYSSEAPLGPEAKL